MDDTQSGSSDDRDAGKGGELRSLFRFDEIEPLAPAGANGRNGAAPEPDELQRRRARIVTRDELFSDPLYGPQASLLLDDQQPRRRAARKGVPARLAGVAGIVLMLFAAASAAALLALNGQTRAPAAAASSTSLLTDAPAAHANATAHEALATLLPGLNPGTFNLQLGKDIHRLARSVRTAPARQKPRHRPRARTLVHPTPTNAAPAVSSAPISSSTEPPTAAAASSYSRPAAYSPSPAGSSGSSGSSSLSSSASAVATKSSTSTKNTTPGPTGFGEAVGSNCNPSCP